MHFSTLGRRGALVVLALCFLLTGCSKSTVTKENYDKIKNDMTLADVEGILGRGDSVGDGSNIAAQAGVDVTVGAAPSNTLDYKWENGKNSIVVTFNNAGKVTAKRNEGL